MRKKTEPHTRKEHQASSGEKSGLIAKNQNRKQSAEAEPVLDNRSHRTSLLFTKPRSRAKHGGGVSAPFTNATPSQPARQAARSAALREMAC
jgi:hypothetical protein